MGKQDLKTKAHSLVDDVVCQGVCYRFELGVGDDGRYSAALIRPGDIGGSVSGGSYGSMAAMAAKAPADLLRQGVPPAVVSYVTDSLSLFLAYR